jgi:hypothetical protein
MIDYRTVQCHGGKPASQQWSLTFFPLASDEVVFSKETRSQGA